MSTGRARRRETQIHLLPLPPRGEASRGSDPDVVPRCGPPYRGGGLGWVCTGRVSSRSRVVTGTRVSVVFRGLEDCVGSVAEAQVSVGALPSSVHPSVPIPGHPGGRTDVQNPACPMALPCLIPGRYPPQFHLHQLSRGGAVSTCGNTHMPAPLPQDTPTPLPAPHPP